MSNSMVMVAGLVAVIVAALYLRYRERRLVFDTIRFAIERSGEVDREAIAAIVADRNADADLRKGVLFVAIAAAAVVFAFAVRSDEAFGPLLGLAAFPGFVGAAYIVFHLIDRGGRRD